MKTATIVPSDNMIYIDGKGVRINCSEVEQSIHAIQWNELAQKGWIEYVDLDPNDNVRAENKAIDNVDAWRPLIETAATMLAAAKPAGTPS